MGLTDSTYGNSDMLIHHTMKDGTVETVDAPLARLSFPNLRSRLAAKARDGRERALTNKGTACTDGLAPTVKFETRLEAAARERRERVLNQEAAYAAAEAKGELWTVQAVLSPNVAACLIYSGRKDCTTEIEATYSGQAVFGPHYLIGPHHQIMAEVVKLFRVDGLSIRTIR